eukprot:CAMPEP_0119567066 /NCGR_PEP_ID=MMETSP1352-20130426/34865_1 /TAXON_ID=265584 /ORGANISM="Stauroneis constricta, Strain CCMP1120" /LENGTH=240 /DNA_ID=CAMNT_0007616267 /DNA_START=204 /DNA_END=926 /DNA_ORIENTATION=+
MRIAAASALKASAALTRTAATKSASRAISTACSNSALVATCRSNNAIDTTVSNSNNNINRAPKRFLGLPPGSFRGYPSIRDPSYSDRVAGRPSALTEPYNGSSAASHAAEEVVMDPAGAYRRFGTGASAVAAEDYDQYALHGSPVSPTYTDLVMYDTDDTVLNTNIYMTPIEERGMETVSELTDVIHNANLMAMEDCGIVEGEDYYETNDSHSNNNQNNELTDYDIIMNRGRAIDIGVVH